MVAVHERVVEDRHADGVGPDAVREDQRATDRLVIHAGESRAVQRAVADGQRNVIRRHHHRLHARVGTDHGDDRRADILEDADVVRREADARIRVLDDDNRVAGSNQLGAAGAGEAGGELEIAGDVGHINQRDGNRLDGLAIGEGERAGGGRVVHVMHRAAVRRGVIDRHHAIGVIQTQHGHAGEAKIFRSRVRGGGEGDARFIVENSHNGISRCGERGAAARSEQVDIKIHRALRDGVVHERHGDDPVRHAITKGQRAAGGRVVHARQRGSR